MIGLTLFVILVLVLKALEFERRIANLEKKSEANDAQKENPK
jgi:hypothetical protein